MRPALLLVFCLAAAPAFAGDAELPEPEFHCDQKNLPSELEALCAGLAEGYRDAMARPVEITGSGRPALTPRPDALSYEYAKRGLDAQKIDRSKNPLAEPPERGVGVRVKTTNIPLEFYTEMVQPGSEADTILNWELKTEQAPPDNIGVFYGAATTGTYNGGMTENLAGYAGLRGVAKPVDNLQLGAEIAPRAGLNDLSSPDAVLSVEPKLTAKSDLGQLGESDFVGTFDANAGYNLPLEGDPNAYGGFRFTVRPR